MSDSDEELPPLQGEGALLSAMARGRTGKMGDIVATIQREQDEIIRAPSTGPTLFKAGQEPEKLLLLYTVQHICCTHTAEYWNAPGFF